MCPNCMGDGNAAAWMPLPISQFPGLAECDLWRERGKRERDAKNRAEVIMTSDEEKMKNQSPTEERHVTIRQDLWHALLKIAGQQVDSRDR